MMKAELRIKGKKIAVIDDSNNVDLTKKTKGLERYEAIELIKIRIDEILSLCAKYDIKRNISIVHGMKEYTDESGFIQSISNGVENVTLELELRSN